jgi:hypothetical protein
MFSESRDEYALAYDAATKDVFVAPQPSDCDFLHAPIGSKDCHYEKLVEVTRYSSDTQSGQPIVSYDDGKSWNWLPPGQKPGPIEVYVIGNRVEGAQ